MYLASLINHLIKGYIEIIEMDLTPSSVRYNLRTLKLAGQKKIKENKAFLVSQIIESIKSNPNKPKDQIVNYLVQSELTDLNKLNYTIFQYSLVDILHKRFYKPNIYPIEEFRKDYVSGKDRFRLWANNDEFIQFVKDVLRNWEIILIDLSVESLPLEVSEIPPPIEAKSLTTKKAKTNPEKTRSWGELFIQRSSLETINEILLRKKYVDKEMKWLKIQRPKAVGFVLYLAAEKMTLFQKNPVFHRKKKPSFKELSIAMNEYYGVGLSPNAYYQPNYKTYQSDFDFLQNLI